jgi:hypothetical protein
MLEGLSKKSVKDSHGVAGEAYCLQVIFEFVAFPRFAVSRSDLRQCQQAAMDIIGVNSR